MQTLLETKKNFVKCISHEVRTPLNTVRMGLQLLLSRSTEFCIPEECMLILSDINSSCENSIDVLNELLLYDKMEDNTVQIEKESTLIRKILLDTIAPFAVQVWSMDCCLPPSADANVPSLYRPIKSACT